MEEHWQKFIVKLDLLLEEALRLCVKFSMQIMLTILHGDGTTGPSPLIKLTTDLSDNKVTRYFTFILPGTYTNCLFFIADNFYSDIESNFLDGKSFFVGHCASIQSDTPSLRKIKIERIRRETFLFRDRRRRGLQAPSSGYQPR